MGRISEDEWKRNASLDCFHGGSRNYWIENQFGSYDMYMKPQALREALRRMGWRRVRYQQVESQKENEVTVKVTLDDEIFYQAVPIDMDEETAAMKAFAIVVANETGYGYGGLPREYMYKDK